MDVALDEGAERGVEAKSRPRCGDCGDSRRPLWWWWLQTVKRSV